MNNRNQISKDYLRKHFFSDISKINEANETKYS